MPVDSGVGFSSIVMTNGARSMGGLTNEPKVTLHKDDQIWKADFIALNELLKNSDAYFVFEVPAHAFSRYSVLTDEWDAPLVELPSDSTDKAIGKERGLKVVFRHPLWRTNDLYQDIEIMVFTHKQWKEEHDGLFFPYAGGIISEMWHNDKYVFGLYSRYNAYDDVKGWKESC